MSDLLEVLQVESSDKAVMVGLLNAAILVANEEAEAQRAQKRASTSATGEEAKKTKDDKVFVNEEAINARIDSLNALVDQKQYSQKKMVFYKQYYRFLNALTPPKTWHEATPVDVRKFLVWIEKDGKTKLHVMGCVNRGKQKSVQTQCCCPMTMAWGTLDSKVGMLRALYRDNGCGADWGQGGSNPAASPEVKKHLQACSIEQGKCLVSVTQAVPLFLEKTRSLARYIEYHMDVGNLSLIKRLLLLRDVTFFRVVVQTGDRANDLGGLQTANIFHMNQREGLILKIVDGKTASFRRPRFVPLFPSEDMELCPVKSVYALVRDFESAGFGLKGGYLFRLMSTDRGSFINEPVTTSAINSRLQMLLDRSGLFEGETIHGARRGLALMLTSLGVKVCWASRYN